MMNEVIYVIVDKENGSPTKGSGPRKILAYTTVGRAKAAMKTHMMSESKYEVVEFIRKGDE